MLHYCLNLISLTGRSRMVGPRSKGVEVEIYNGVLPTMQSLVCALLCSHHFQ